MGTSAPWILDDFLAWIDLAEEEEVHQLPLMGLMDFMMSTNMKVNLSYSFTCLWHTNLFSCPQFSKAQLELQGRLPQIIETHPKMWSQAKEQEKAEEYLVGKLWLAKAKVKLHQTKATTYSEQLLHFQISLKEFEKSCSKAKRKEKKGRKCQELLVAEVESLKEELANYKAREEGCEATQKKIILEVTRILWFVRFLICLSSGARL